ncbi:hypothetical protein ACH5Y9_18385 [Methylomonas sp. BW4-1]|uniref:hypothetical protein n=1 Tax=Methylomonas sp. BW4-1 TaxID=3376685 RepID=UPI0040411619
MEQEPDIHAIRDEVFRKIGRNVVNFQKIEQMLKYLIVRGNLSGYKSELNQILESRQALANRKTLGTLVGELVENAFNRSSESSEPDIKPKDPYIHFRFFVEADAEFYEEKRQELKRLVEERNELIHHLLPKFNQDSLESCLEINDYLDHQLEQQVSEFNYLKSLCETYFEFADFLSSEQGRNEFKLSMLQESSIVRLLLDISIQKPRKDGWTYLSLAVQRVHQILPGEITNLKVRWGYEKLTDLMMASNYFDVKEETLNNSQRRFIYRSKPDLVYLEQDRVLQFLLNISEQAENAEGWFSLVIAEEQVREVLVEEFERVKFAWNCNSLKDLMIEWDCFEFEGGGFKPKVRSRGMC